MAETSPLGAILFMQPIMQPKPLSEYDSKALKMSLKYRKAWIGRCRRDIVEYEADLKEVTDELEQYEADIKKITAELQRRGEQL